MAGIIAGFLEGSGSAMADIGKMAFADKLSKERAEADHLRNTALERGDDPRTTRQYESEEKALDRKAAIKKAQSKDGRTTSVKDAAALMAEGYPKDVANAVAHGAMKQIKDEETGQMVMINSLSGEEVGRLTDQGWLKAGEMPPKAEVTSKHRKQAKKAGSEKAGYLSTDVTDFPETEGDRKAWEREEAQRIANEERSGTTGAGIIDSAAGKAKPAQQTAPKAALDAVVANKNLLPQFIKKYGYDPTK